MGDRGSTRSHKVDNSSGGTAHVSANNSYFMDDDDQNESLLQGKIKKKKSSHVINHSLNSDSNSTAEVE